VQEFNQEAAVFFGIKRADAIGNDFMEMFIPEPVRKDAEKEMQKLLNNMQDGRLYLQVKASGSKTSVVEWSVNILNNKEGQATCVLLKAEEGRHGSPDLALSERPN
jgi:PAS domain S-box-containing protein